MPFINYNTKIKAAIFSGIQSAIDHSEQITSGCVTLEAAVIAPEHCHPHEQRTYVLEGQMEFTLDGETQLLLPCMGAFKPSMHYMALLLLLHARRLIFLRRLGKIIEQ
jgi:hypothetical protein